MLLTLVTLPVLAGLAIWWLGDRRAVVRAPLAIGSLAITVGLAVAVAVDQPRASMRWGSGLTLHVQVADVARAPVVLIAFVGLAVVTYGIDYGEQRGRSRMIGLLVAFVGVMELLVLAGDWLTLLTAWELVGGLSWGLIAHHWRGDAPVQAGHGFLATRVGDLGLFVAAGAAFASTGSLEFSALSGSTAGWATVIAAGVVLAAMAKSAQLPFSPWLFSAMAGPTPASALLHSATMVAAGAYLLARLQPFLDTVAWFGPTVIAVGLATALAGGVVAMVQAEAKRVLAASTSAQYGLMFVAVGAGYPTVAIAHLVAHGVLKALLFVSAGVAIDASGDTRLVSMRLGRTLPVTAALSAVGALALAAVPPLGAAWTKEEVVAAAGEQAWWLAALVILAGVLSAAYAARFELLAYGRDALAESDAGGDGAPRTTQSLITLGALAGGAIVLGLLWVPWGSDRLVALVGGELPKGAPWEVPVSIGAVGLAIAGVFAADRRGRLVEPWSGSSRTRLAAWFDLAEINRVLIVDPTLALARSAATFDDRVVDAGVRGAARVAAATSGHAARFDDRVVDGGVRGVTQLANRVSVGLAAGDDRVIDAGVRGTARLGRWSAQVSTRLGEAGIDGVVEGIAELAGNAGRQSRRLQSGQTHQYYAGIAIGLVALVLVAALWR